MLSPKPGQSEAKRSHAHKPPKRGRPGSISSHESPSEDESWYQEGKKERRKKKSASRNKYDNTSPTKSDWSSTSSGSEAFEAFDIYVLAEAVPGVGLKEQSHLDCCPMSESKWNIGSKNIRNPSRWENIRHCPSEFLSLKTPGGNRILGMRPDRNKPDIIALRYIEDHDEYERKEIPFWQSKRGNATGTKVPRISLLIKGINQLRKSNELKVRKITWG